MTGDEFGSSTVSRRVDLLVRSWGLMADVGFCDLILLQRSSSTSSWTVTAQVRPTTHQTLYSEDLVGRSVTVSERPALGERWAGRSWADSHVFSIDTPSPARSRAIPIPTTGAPDDAAQPTMILLCEAALDAGRRRGRLESAYVEIFDQLADMIHAGRFPFADEFDPVETFRVGDGVIVLDAYARIRFASPNATSSLHRLGVQANVEGKRLQEVGLAATWLEDVASTRVPLNGELTAVQIDRSTGRGLLSGQGITAGGSAALLVPPLGHSNRDADRGVVEANPTVVAVYLLPLIEGSVLLLRDVTDVRRRDRLLRSKDATIREVHHRVKNNLQTISSLLRLQGRRTDSAAAREAIEESVRRIRSMALVHETLSQGVAASVPFHEVIRPLVRVVEEGLQESGQGSRRVRFTIDGSAGELPAEIATPLSIVLVELLQNAVEHGFVAAQHGSGEGPDGLTRGVVRVRFHRVDNPEPELRVVVQDNGRGFPPGFSLSAATGGSSLGLTIVRTLITSELGGVISIYNVDGAPLDETEVAAQPVRHRAEHTGAVVEIRIPLNNSGTDRLGR